MDIEHKNELKEIYDTLVRVCNAIVSVIDVDITIVDKNLNRIIGTGKYVINIGEKLDDNTIFAYALRKGEKFIIENPKSHEACISCKDKINCKEFAQVCCPIKIDNSVVGIIGLIAFNEKQRDIILSKKENLLDFLSNMAELIASKIKENRRAHKVSLMAKELETLVNSIDSGVIFTDENGEILRYNSIADEIFNINKKKTNIRQLLDISIMKIKGSKSQIKNKEFHYNIKGIKYRGFYNGKPLIIEGRVIGFIFTFNKMKEIIRVIHDIASSNMVTTFDDIFGESRNISMVKNYAKRISKGSSTVLIQGESGTGKELFARAIHYESDRKSHPFIAVNCSAIPENLIESELFGYEEGAFTGAKKGGKIGKFELANKGTIFLDEIGEMPLNLQAKLLRVLQENSIERVGGNTIVSVDVRIIAASNKILEKKVMDNEFREDLFYRLNVIPIYLPPLRERIEDIPILANTFLEKYNQKLNRAIEGIDEAVLELFKVYKWPGNVRELENVVEYSVNMCSGYKISISDLPRRLKDKDYEILGRDYEDTIIPIKELERKEITKALNKYGYDSEGVVLAAKELGISRATIYRRMKLYNIQQSQNES